MAKLTLADLASLANQTSAITTINNNSALIETALENTLSRDGTTPNTMNADIDLNSNDILNGGVINARQFKIGGVDISLLASVTVRGAWLTATAYVQLDLVTEAGATYICLEDHTSGTFATDLAANKWAVIEASYDSAAVVITGGTIDGVNVTTLLNDADIGVTVQGFDADTLKADTSDILTAKFTEDFSTGGTSGSVSLDFTNTSRYDIAMTGAITTLTLANTTDGDSLEIFFVQNGTSTVDAWAASGLTFKWVGGAAPTIVTGANNATLVQIRRRGTVLYGNSVNYE